MNDGTPISGCIIALNEADRIADCIASLDFCDEVLVVDSHSTDGTREVAAAAGARVIERDWPGHVAQKEFAIRAARNDWVLCIDADERVSPELRAEILDLVTRGRLGDPPAGADDVAGPAGWRFPRLSSYLGEWVRCGTWYPDRQLRLFDRRRGHWGGHDPHDRVELDGRVDRLRGDLLHHPYRTISEHMRTIDAYTTIMARGLHARGREASWPDLLFRPGIRFFRFYFLGRGFLLGWRGLALAYFAAHYVRLKYVKLKILQAGGEISGAGPG